MYFSACMPCTSLNGNAQVCHKAQLFPSVFTVAAFFQALHYNTIMKKSKNCQMPFIFGCFGTGKTTVARHGLAFTGEIMQRLWSQGTKKEYIQLCCSGCLPLLINNPKSKQAISDLVIVLFNGITEGRLTRPS